MATEYGLELLNKVQKDFAKLYANDSKIKALTKKIANKSTSYVDANDYAIRTGELLSKALTKHVNSNELNYISKEMAEDILRPTLTTDYELIRNAVLEVQKNQNIASGIRLKPQAADLDTSRIDGLINKISSYDTLDQGEWLLKEPIVNYSQSVVDNTAKKNMETYSKAGMAPKIFRKAEAGACKWCKALAGTYDYADVKAAGSDVYRRHENCRCLVIYKNGNRVETPRGWADYDKRQLIKILEKEEGEVIRKKIIEKKNRQVFIHSAISARKTGIGKAAAITQFDVRLSNNQIELLENIKKNGGRLLTKKSNVSMHDLAALTAKTGNEYALFTRGGQRLVVAGDKTSVPINVDGATNLLENGFRWSGHTHPGVNRNSLIASDDDYEILKAFKQKQSVVYNSLGEYMQFNLED